jgi:hypothetical protein
MAKIKQIRLRDLQYWDTVTSTWKDLYAVDTAVETERSLGVGSQYSVAVYDAGAGAGLDPDQPYSYGINWDYFSVDDGLGTSDEWTLFYTGTPPEGTKLLVSTIKSLKIRYKISVTDDSDPANTWDPGTQYYQIISGAYPADHISYSGVITTGPFAPSINVKLPGISNTMVTNSATLFSWAADVNNWKVTWKRPDGTERLFTPSNAQVIGTYASSDANYAGAYVYIRLTLPTIMVGQSGAHILSTSFLPNDQQTSGFLDFADTHTWTAVITAYSPSMEDPLLMSFDKTVFMTINFSAFSAG